MIGICKDSFLGKEHFTESVAKILTDHIFDESFKHVIMDRYREISSASCDSTDSFCKRCVSFSLREPWSALRGGENLGHDLPVWARAGDADFLSGKKFTVKPIPELAGKTVLVFGIDPKRKNQEAGIISLGAPWGLHSEKYRSGGKIGNASGVQAKYIYHIVCTLVQSNANVYLTDFYKIYSGENQPSEKETYTQKSISILNAEIDLIRPDFIVSVGESLKEKLPKDLASKINFFRHPNSLRNMKQDEKIACYENRLLNLVPQQNLLEKVTE